MIKILNSCPEVRVCGSEYEAKIQILRKQCGLLHVIFPTPSYFHLTLTNKASFGVFGSCLFALSGIVVEIDARPLHSAS